MPSTILLLAANPKDTTPLRLAQEAREIDNGLKRARSRAEFTLEQVWATRPVDVRRAMLDLRPRIVHFMGHGGGENGIAFEDDEGQPVFVSGEALAGFFELFADQLQCVVLNACYSEVQAQAIAQHIPFVVGMRQSISDTSSLAFAVAFYDAVGAGEKVDFAFRLACNAIAWEGTAENAVPVLHTRFSNMPVAPATPAPATAAYAPALETPAEPSRGVEAGVAQAPFVTPATSARYDVSSLGGVTVIEFGQVLEYGRSQETAALATDKAKVVLDLTRSEYVSSGDLRVILRTVREVQRRQGQVALAVSDELRETLEMTGFAKLAPVYATVGEAVEALT